MAEGRVWAAFLKTRATSLHVSRLRLPGLLPHGLESFEISSLLRPNGLLIISDVFPTATIQTASHVRLRSLSEYNRLFSENQTRILHIEPIFAILQPPSFIPSLSWFWKGYALFWRYAWRLARWSVMDHLLPPVLAWLDKNWFLPKWGSQAPNNKWLFALKENVA